MKPDSALANKIGGKEFIITAEYLPRRGAGTQIVEDCARIFKNGPVAVNVADNHYGVAMSSLALVVPLRFVLCVGFLLCLLCWVCRWVFS